MKPLLVVLCAATLLGPRIAWADASPVRKEKPLELAVLGTYSNDFDYHRLGGNVRLTQFLTRTFSIGLNTGAEARLDNEAPGVALIVPIDLLTAWDIPVAKSRVSVQIAMSTGYAMAVSTHFSTSVQEHIVHLEVESGVKVRLTERIGLTAVMYGGMHYYVRYWPMGILGAKLGPCFWF